MRLSETPNSTPPGPLRLVQVGAGLMGEAWLGVISGSPDTELVGLVDLDLDVARRAAERTGVDSVAIGRSLTDVLARVTADAVVNVTVPAAHRAVSVEALRAGLPVLSEKPLAGSVAAGLSIVAAAELTGQLLMVSQSRRYFRQLPAFRRPDRPNRPGRPGRLCVLQGPPLRRVSGADGLPPADRHGDPSLRSGPRSARQPIRLRWCASRSTRLGAGTPGTRPPTSASSSPPASASASPPVGAVQAWKRPGTAAWRVSGAGGSAAWDGEHEPVAETADGHRLAADITSGPEQIAGSLAEFVAALRTGAVPSGEAHSNVLSLTMVEAAIRSAREARRVEIAEVLADAHADALAAEEDADVRTVLAGWTSVHDAVGAAAATRLQSRRGRLSREGA